jgi:hypothetical protein
MAKEHVQAYINGEWVDGSAGTAEYFSSFTDEVLGTFTLCDNGDVRRAVTSAKAAQVAWAMVPLLDKVDLMYEAYRLCGEANEEIAQSITREMGKTIQESREEMEKYAWGHFRRAAEDMLRFRGMTMPNSETRSTSKKMFVQQYPLGVVGVISPFNFPVDIPAIATPTRRCRATPSYGSPPKSVQAAPLATRGSSKTQAFLRVSSITFRATPTPARRSSRALTFRDFSSRAAPQWDERSPQSPDRD